MEGLLCAATLASDCCGMPPTKMNDIDGFVWLFSASCMLDDCTASMTITSKTLIVTSTTKHDLNIIYWAICTNSPSAYRVLGHALTVSLYLFLWKPQVYMSYRFSIKGVAHD